MDRPTSRTNNGHQWWKSGVIYHIYPRSFQDSNGDGIGDLDGIASRLDYLEWLGVDAIWISPVYPSPMADFGYDVSDYKDIDSIFGSLADFDRLLAAAHARGIRVLLDFVPNHTSDQHPWFIDARRSRTDPKRDMYIWRDPAPGGKPPNNWLSDFGGSAWEWDEKTGQYYYHAFLRQQPDLNWRNPAVRAEMYDVLRFWLDRGVDGFRVDVLWHLIKDEKFRDNPPNPDWIGQMAPHKRVLQVYSADRPEVHEVVAGMRNVLEEYGGDRLLIGEIYLPLSRLVTYYGPDLGGAHLPFNFHLVQAQWNARGLAREIQEYEDVLPAGGWPNWVLGNHDKPRIASRVGQMQSRVAAMLLLTLRGTPTIYYGDEIGMANVDIPPSQVKDPFEINVPGQGFGRDPQRTPMQWTAEKGAGFSSGTPWLPLPLNATTVNVETQKLDPGSMLSLHRRLLSLRREHTALSLGRYISVSTSGDVLAYVREAGGEKLLVALNLGSQPADLALPWPCRILLSTHGGRESETTGRRLQLNGDEGILAIAQ